MDTQPARNRLEAIVEGLYAAILDDAELTASVAQIGELVGAAHGGILCWNGHADNAPRPVTAFTSEPDRLEQFVTSYTADFHHLDPCKPIWSGVPDAGWYVDTLRSSAREREMSPYVQEFFRPHGMGGFASMKIAADRIWALSLERDLDTPDFCPANLQLVSTIMPHLRRALQLRDKMFELRTLATAGLNVLERLTVPLWIVDETGNIHFANHCAAGLMGLASSALSGQGRRLIMSAAIEQPRYEKLLRQAFCPFMRLAGAMTGRFLNPSATD